jgi:hypothetical protein
MQRPYVLLAENIILRAIEDYAVGCKCIKGLCRCKLDKQGTVAHNDNIREMKSVEDWVNRKNASFDWCASAWGKSTPALYELMNKKMKLLREGCALRKGGWHEVRGM